MSVLAGQVLGQEGVKKKLWSFWL